MKSITKLHGSWAALGVAAITLLSLRAGDTSAAPALVNMNLANAPLFLSADIKPNLIMAIDDSGSMDFEVSLPGNDGAAWWRTAASGTCTAGTANSFAGCSSNATATGDAANPGVINFNNGGTASMTWLKYAYLFPNGINGANNSFQRRLGEPANTTNTGGGDHFALAPIRAIAWTRSPDWNRAYFDPTVTYTPWVDGGGFTFTNATPTATRWDPVFGAGNTVNLTRDIAGAGQLDTTAACSGTTPAITDGWTFRVFTGMTLPAGTCLRFPGRNWEQVRPGGTCAVNVNNGCQVGTTLAPANFTLTTNRAIGIRYFPATFYLPATDPIPDGFNSANVITGGVGPGGQALNGFEIKPANFTDAAKYNAMLQNFANWFQFYRKRHQSLRNGLGRAFADLGGLRVAGFPINSPTVDVAMGDLDSSTDRDALYQDFYVDWVRSGGTPNRLAVANLIRNFRRTDGGAPVTHSCQKNFGMLFTDGFSNPPVVGDAIDGVAGGNADGGGGAPYADTIANTMADATWRAYNNPLRTGTGFPAGKVQVPEACNTGTPDARLDCNRNLHMNFYAVTLNTRGIAFDPDITQDPYAVTPTWPTSFPQRHPTAVDDIWHATVNGRGRLLNARRPNEIADRMAEVLTSILAEDGSAASAAVNATSVSNETQVFQARFDSGNWTGQVIARGVDFDGSLIESGTRYWVSSAGSFPAPNDRDIVTTNPDGQGVPFRWSDLDSVHQNALDDFNGLGERTLEYLRGDQTYEVANATMSPNNTYRTREILLGDIVNSSPVFVGRPAFRYRDSLESAPYSEFKATHKDRTGVLYVGSNDGMLHAFTAIGGEELFAYVPGAVVKNLSQLADPGYAHRYYVDGSPTAGDAFFDGAWHTVIVGGLNNGGQAIYALDVTDPSQLTEGNADNVALWEFTDEDDADLGYTYSRPAIVRMRNGQWAAVFGNGYNSTVSDGHASGTGNAVLFIVDIETGDLIRKIDTGIGYEDGSSGMPNGLATPSLVDLNADGIVDLAYAGDLYGNLWKFDLRSTDKDDWDVAYDDGSGEKAPIFVAKDDSDVLQPITARPEVVRGPKGRGLVVLFGTGKYLEGSDELIGGATEQSFYGILDRNSGTSTDIVTGRSSLTEQEITVEQLVDGTRVRETTSNALGSNSGWYIDLVSPVGFNGEKQVTDPVVRNGRVVFTTIVPDPDPCVYGGTSWLMALDAITGGVPQPAPFDISDEVSGIETDVGITPKPAIVASDTKEFAYLPGTVGTMQVVGLNTGPGQLGRQSWRQVR